MCRLAYVPFPNVLAIVACGVKYIIPFRLDALDFENALSKISVGRANLKQPVSADRGSGSRPSSPQGRSLHRAHAQNYGMRSRKVFSHAAYADRIASGLSVTLARPRLT